MYTNIRMNSRNLIIIAGGALILIAGIFLLNTSTPPPTQKPPAMREPVNTQAVSNQMNILLSAENNSNESGMANLKEMGGRVIVTLSLSGYTANVVQPAHIHMGICPGVGAVKYPLTSVVNGTSVTVLNATLAQLMQQPLAINVHKSATAITNYTSCGMLSAR